MVGVGVMQGSLSGGEVYVPMVSSMDGPVMGGACFF